MIGGGDNVGLHSLSFWGALKKSWGFAIEANSRALLFIRSGNFCILKEEE
jgi:hypothetical protein